jgi:hypothetical protein
MDVKSLYVVSINCVLLLFHEKDFICGKKYILFSDHVVPITASGPQG